MPDSTRLPCPTVPCMMQGQGHQRVEQLPPDTCTLMLQVTFMLQVTPMLQDHLIFFLMRSWLVWPHFFFRQFTARGCRRA